MTLKVFQHDRALTLVALHSNAVAGKVGGKKSLEFSGLFCANIKVMVNVLRVVLILKLFDQ